MPSCAVCGKPLEKATVKCARCGAEMHRQCAKKTLGKSYCRSCYKEGKKQSRYERMAQRDYWR
ncbi:MAG: hypothetical protein QW835_02190 [Candidatus Hadarchaeum sp.]|uniref:hypothetical protein n=1 Tax=Candidatus Hadarchaeum sp. TaxID=2883567 RepID=UPI00316E251A